MIWITSAEALAAIRICVCGAFFVSTALTSFEAISELPVTLMRPPGVMAFLGWKLYDRVVTPHGMLALKSAMLATLGAGAVGWWTPLTTKCSALLVLFYQGILGSFGHACAESAVGLYCLSVLAFSPCGDAFSLDRRGKPSVDRPGWAYAYPILLMQLLLSWSYCAAGLAKLRDSGLGYFAPDTLPTHAVRNSLLNLHDTQFQLGLSLPSIRHYLPPLVAASVVWEIAFPLAVFIPRTRRFFLVTGLIFHATTMLLMNIMFWNQVAMYVVFVDWPGVIGRVRAWRLAAKSCKSGASST